MGLIADVNIMEKETSLPLSEFETRFSGHPFGWLVVVLNMLSLFINVCNYKLRNRHRIYYEKIRSVRWNIFSSALFVTLDTVQSKSYYPQTEPTFVIHNGSKILIESIYLSN